RNHEEDNAHQYDEQAYSACACGNNGLEFLDRIQIRAQEYYSHRIQRLMQSNWIHKQGGDRKSERKSKARMCFPIPRGCVEGRGLKRDKRTSAQKAGEHQSQEKRAVAIHPDRE